MKNKGVFLKAKTVLVKLLATMLLLPLSSFAAGPSITTQPKNQSVLANSNAVFTVVATGSPTLVYQWSFNGKTLTNSTHIAGATNTILTVSNIVGSDAGNYQVMVANSHGTVTSSNAYLTVLFTNHIHYVNPASLNPIPPYGEWDTAATNIQSAIDVANSGDRVLVTNGIYSVGSRVVDGMSTRVAAVVPVSIIGLAGPMQTIIDGGGSNRCVYLTNGAVLSGFTVTNGTTSEYGGGVRCESASGFITNCTLTGNSSSQYGGGVYQGTLTNCTLSGNSAGLGGGAAYAILNGCVVNGNVSGDGSGAYYCTLNGCILSSNVPLGGYASFGGGAYGGTLNNCTLTANHANQSGGGIFSATASNCLFVANSADNFQGGGADSSTLYSCTLSNNSAGQWGGNVSESTLSSCWLTGGSAFMGGGARTSTLIGCVLSNNTAIYGEGGGANSSTLTNCVLISNVAWYSGGGADNSTIVNSLILSNSAPYGGGINGCTVTNSIVNGNTAYDINAGGGGGANGSSLYNCLLTGNSSVLNAGGAQQSTLVNCTVTANTATDDGGGVDSSTLTNCMVFFNNSPASANYSGTNYMAWCCTTSSPTAGAGDVIIGINNISTAPIFADAANGNYRLYPGSPGIDAGNNAAVPVSVDLDGNSRIVNGTVDLGAYEFQNTPFVEIQPTNQTVPFGMPSVSFSVVAVGPGTLTYQWRFNGANIAGATNSSLVLSYVQYAEAGTYSVVVVNSFGPTVSSNAVLTVVPPTAPSFVSEPTTNQFAPAGTNVTLTASATGAPPPAYQWYFNGIALADNSHYTGTASGTLQISNALTNDTGNYFVIVTNTGGSVTSSIATVTVLVPPAITLQPAGQTLLQGSTATFAAAASGDAPLSYQWLFNGSPLSDGGQISGSATTNLTISNLQLANGGSYVFMATNPVGSATSTAAALTVIAPPVILQQPMNETAQLGAAAIFSVAATGTGPLSYQWLFNGSEIAGATNAILSLSNLQASQAGAYSVQISNTLAAIVSSNALLTVALPPSGVPFITGFSPNPAVPGAFMTISGTNFSPVATSNIVYFGAVQATVLSASETNLTVIVPVGATFSPISETVGGLTAWADESFLPTFSSSAVFSSASLGPQLVLPTGTGPNKVVIADLDGDGKPDLIVSDDYGSTISLYRNISTNGVLSTASFAPPVTLATPSGSYSPYGLVVADVDGDGKLDIIVSDDSQPLVSIYRNNCTPGNISSTSFAARVDFATGTTPMGIAMRDLDGDGRPDLVVANAGDGTISIFRNTGVPGSLTTNSFAPRVDIPTGSGCDDVVVADLDGDGKPDIVAANDGGSTLSVLQNLSTPGSLTFAAPVSLLTLNEPVNLAVGDLDGDGKPDLIVASYLPDSEVSVFRNVSIPGSLTTDSFAPRVDFALGGRGHTPALADLDGSGKPSLAVVTELSSLLSVFRNVSTPGSFTNSSLAPRIDFGTGWNAWGVAIGDLDGDGRPDIVFANSYDSTISIYQNEVPFGSPVVTVSPASQMVPLTGLLQLTGAAQGQSPLAFQWYFNGTNLVDDGRITGSSTGTLSISNILYSDAGSYYFVVTNSFGAATSTVATIAVYFAPPAFPQQLSNQAVVLGGDAVISENVSGSQPITYQWFSIGGPLSDSGRISGSATTSLNIANVQTNDAVSYWLVASNAAGMATSSVVNLSVLLPVAITQQPSNQVLAVGSTFVLTTAASGSGPLGYQWFLNNSPLSDNSRIIGSATSTLTVSNAQTSDTGNYTVVVTNLLTSATSAVASVTVFSPPVVTIQPLGRSIPLGLTNIFSAGVSGTAPFTYQWLLNGTNIPGATNLSYFIPAVGTNNLGVYQFVVSNTVGVAVSSNAWLTAGPVAAWGYDFYGQCNVPPGLSNVTTIAGGTIYSLASRLDGSIAAWGSSLSTYTNSSMSNVLALAASGGGVLALRSDGSVVGSSQINPLSTLKSYPPTNTVAVAAGATFGLALRAEGTVAAWGYTRTQLPFTVPPGLAHVTAISAGYEHAMALRNDGTVAAWGYGPETNVPVGLSNVVAIAAGSGYSLVLKANGTVTAWGSVAATNVPAGLSNVVAIFADNFAEPNYGSVSGGGNVSFAVRSDGTVVAWGMSSYGQTNLPSGLSNVEAIANGANHTLALVNDGTPQILRQPAGATACSGGDWNLQVTAAGAAPLSYQWLFNGTNIAGATNSTLLLPAIQTASAGNYQVVVSNSLGVATSIAVPINVMDSAPFLLTQPATNIQAFLGNRLALSTAVAGSGPLQYQWLLNGQAIAGATNDTLNFDRVHLATAGGYTLLASNSFGSVTSAVANVTVQQVIVWGGNINGVTNIPPRLTNATAISANSYGNIVLRADGTVSVWDDSGYISTNTTGISNVVEVSAGYNSYLTLKSNGQPYVWGASLPTSLTNLADAQSNIVSGVIASPGCALLRADGRVLEVSSGSVNLNPIVTNGIALEPYYTGYLVLKADGTVFSPVFAIPPLLFTNAASFAASENSASSQVIALKRDGRVREFPAILLSTNLSNVIAVAASSGNPLDFAVLQDGSVAWAQANGVINASTNVPYGLTSVQALDAGYQHCLALLSDRQFPPTPLNNALDTSNFVVSSRGAPQWFGQTNITHDGTNAAQSAPIGNNSSSSMRMWVVGPITASFWWKVSSATNHHFLSFSAGGAVLTNISGEVDWQQCTVGVPPGNQILQWTYSKDGSGSVGQDAGWVDQLQLIPQAPTISMQPASQQVVGPTNVTLTVGASGTPPLQYVWWKDGSAVGNTPSLTILNAVRANSGTYWVTVHNAVGTVVSSNAVLVVRVPQLLGAPALQPDGSIVLNSTDAGGGLLSASAVTNFQAQVSTNLTAWVTLTNALTFTNGMIELNDPAATGSAARFYRIVELP